MNYKIAILKGDGIGPEIIDATINVLNAVQKRFNHKFEYNYALLGGIAIDECGEPLPQATIDICKYADAVLLGAVGGKKWDSNPSHLRPEKGLLGLRSALGLYANIRPALLYPELKAASPLREDIVKNGIDIIIVRELTGGIYFGPRALKDNEAFDTEIYSVSEIERIAKIAFTMARTRRKKVTSIDKANVLDTSKLWRATVTKIAKDYPDVELEHMLVDNCAMQLVKNPAQFDILLCPNMFGDILSDEAAMLTGSLGMLPSSSLGASKSGLYEPIHGSAPDIAGKNIANPIATVLAAAMMLKDSLDLVKEAKAISNSVQKVLSKGFATSDIMSQNTILVSCSKMGELIANEI